MPNSKRAFIHTSVHGHVVDGISNLIMTGSRRVISSSPNLSLFNCFCFIWNTYYSSAIETSTLVFIHFILYLSNTSKTLAWNLWYDPTQHRLRIKVKVLNFFFCIFKNSCNIFTLYRVKMAKTALT